MTFEIQGRDESGQWSWMNVTGAYRDATHETSEDAERAAENLVETTGWDRDRIRVVETKKAFRAHDQVAFWFGPVRASSEEALADAAARNAATEAAGKLGTTFVITEDVELLGAADDGRTDR